MDINLSVLKYNGGLLPDVMLLILPYSHWGNPIKYTVPRKIVSQQPMFPSTLNVMTTFPPEEWVMLLDAKKLYS